MFIGCKYPAKFYLDGSFWVTAVVMISDHMVNRLWQIGIQRKGMWQNDIKSSFGGLSRHSYSNLGYFTHLARRAGVAIVMFI